MDLKARYPRDQWPQELKDAVDKHDKSWIAFLLQPYERLIRWLEYRNNKAWAADHYDNWRSEDLVWRIMFLQGCARQLYVRLELWKKLVPVLLFLSVMFGMYLGSP